MNLVELITQAAKKKQTNKIKRTAMG